MPFREAEGIRWWRRVCLRRLRRLAMCSGCVIDGGIPSALPGFNLLAPVAFRQALMFRLRSASSMSAVAFSYGYFHVRERTLYDGRDVARVHVVTPLRGFQVEELLDFHLGHRHGTFLSVVIVRGCDEVLDSVRGMCEVLGLVGYVHCHEYVAGEQRFSGGAAAPAAAPWSGEPGEGAMLCGSQRERVCYPSSAVPARRATAAGGAAVRMVSIRRWRQCSARPGWGIGCVFLRWRVSVCALSSWQTPEANLYGSASGV